MDKGITVINQRMAELALILVTFYLTLSGCIASETWLDFLYNSKLNSTSRIAHVFVQTALECGLKCNGHSDCAAANYGPETSNGRICEMFEETSGYVDNETLWTFIYTAGADYQHVPTDVHECDTYTAYIADVADSALTGSSQHHDGTHGWIRSRLNTVADVGGRGAWATASNSVGQYIQADLGNVRTLLVIATQGRQDANQWVTSYLFSFSVSGSTYEYISNDDGSETIFSGNSDRDTIVEHEIGPIVTRYVRLYPQSWNSHMSMRWDVYGCALG